MRRRTMLAAAAAAPVAAVATPSAASAAGPRPRHRLAVRGADVSTLAKNEDFGAVYRRADGAAPTRSPSCASTTSTSRG